MKAIVFPLGLSLCVLSGCPDSSSNDDATTNADDGGSTAGDDGGPTTGEPTSGGSTMGPETSDGSGDSTGGPMECLGVGEGTAAEGDPCTANSDCASGVCTLYTDVPVNEDAVCGAEQVGCTTRVTGTVFNFADGMPVADATVKIAAALQAATNPTGAMAIVQMTSDAQGRVDGTSDAAIMAPLGIVALTEASGFFLTSTGVAAPGPDGQSYAVGTGIHDLWAVPTDDLTAWSTELGMDGAIDPGLLPLGDAGGVVGFVRDATGAPVEGAVVSSTDASSSAIIRYLNDDGTFNPDMTSPTGLFVILDPSVPEDFEVSIGGAVAGDGTVGSANGVVFTLIFNT